MGEFASILKANMDAPVLDATGLKGVYQFKMELDTNASARRGLRSIGVATTVRGTPLDEPTGVSTFGAIERLGLRLEKRLVPLDFVVVEKIDRTPTGN